MSDDLYMGPTALAPGAPRHGDWLARLLFLPLGLALIVWILVFFVFFSVSKVDGDSMEPTLRHGDHLLLTRSYGEPHRRDVVVFMVRNSRNGEDGLIKRVVALPGDTVEIRHGLAVVNGAPESTFSIRTRWDDPTTQSAFTIPPGYVYVLGDNRPVALDSRDLGPIPLGAVRSRVAYIFGPVDRVGPVH